MAYAEAAQQLHLTQATVRGRLVQAREMLRTRLSRRGVTLPAGLLAAVLTERAVGVPATLVHATVRAALLFAAGTPAVVGGALASATTLATGGLRTMFLAKLKAMVAVLVLFGAFGTATGFVLHRAWSGPSDPSVIAQRGKEPDTIGPASPAPSDEGIPEPPVAPIVDEPPTAPGRENPAEARVEAEKLLLVWGNNRFATDLYGRLRGRTGNLFLSPVGISAALALVYGGAGGKTAEEMTRVSHFPLEQGLLPEAFAALLSDLNAGGKSHGYRFHLVNGLWSRKSFPFRAEFVESAKRYYGADVLGEFAAFDEDARRRINAWVARGTQGKIQDFLPPGVLTGTRQRQIRHVLANAVYFQGNWEAPFDEKDTKMRPFHLTAKETIQVPSMSRDNLVVRGESPKDLHGERPFRYWDGGTFEILELPYKSKALSLVVLLPKKVDGLAEFEKTLTAENLEKWLAHLKSAKGVDAVQLPRFKVTSAFSLQQTLSAMGMSSAFDLRADFSRMSATEDVGLDFVEHKAFVEVNERGTEAAAATGIGGWGGVPKVFRADHPFVFLIRDNRSGSILFLGRLVDPR
jgi:serpin B